MRLWTLHPRYLDRQNLVALWREALLAQAVLSGATRGYRNHPQLARFRAHPSPKNAIRAYLAGVHAEAAARGYSFDAGKVGRARPVPPIPVTTGQIRHERAQLKGRLAARSPAVWRRWRRVATPEWHPLFKPYPGPVETWERSA